MNPAAKRAIDAVLKHEGGLTMHPADPGNWTGGKPGVGVLKGTNRGISAAAFPDMDIRAVTEDVARGIYFGWYWLPIRGDDLPEPVAFVVMDAAVNSGVSRATGWLQQCAGAVVDGDIGPKTLTAVQAKDAHSLAAEICEVRLAFLQSLSTWPTFGKGWRKRIVDVQREALTL